MSKYTRKRKTPGQDEFVAFWQKLYEKMEPYLTALGVIGAAALSVPSVASAQGVYFGVPGFGVGIGAPYYYGGGPYYGYNQPYGYGYGYGHHWYPHRYHHWHHY